MNVFDSVVRGPQWVPTKLTQIHVLCLISDKRKKKVIIPYVTHLRPFPQNLKVMNKEAVFLFESLCDCSCLAGCPLASFSLSQCSAQLLQLLVANNMGEGNLSQGYGSPGWSVEVR